MAFGVDSVHGHRSFAAPALAAEHRHLVARQGQIDVLQIVLLRTDHMDVLQGETPCNRFLGLYRSLFFLCLGFRIGSLVGVEVFFQGGPGMRFLLLGDSLWSALTKDRSATGTSLRPHVDNPVGSLNEVEVMFDDDDRVAEVDQTLKHF